MSKPSREYEKDGVVVEWRPEFCVHCRSCADGLPEVFNPMARPWVNMDGAPIEAIIEQVSQCPDGALTIRKVKNGEEETED